MTELRFIKDVPALTGGKDAIMTRARQDWTGEPGAPRQEQQKMAVNVILRAIKTQLTQPLADIFQQHVNAVEDHYILMEGEEPDNDDPEWVKGLNQTVFDSMGDLKTVIAKEQLRKWIADDSPISELVGLTLDKAVSDVGNAFEKLGITPADIDSLIPVKAEEVKLDPGWLAKDGAKAEARIEPSARRRRSASIEGPTELTKAAQAALIALQEHSGVKDMDVAKALGVSRASIVGYRDGKTLFSPDEEQTVALRSMLAHASLVLEVAKQDLERAILA